MPEGDTVLHTADTLRDALVGRTLTRSDIRVPRFATIDLSGHTVDEVVSRGKHLFIRVGPASIHSHMKMDGSWRVSTGAGHGRTITGCESCWKQTKFRPCRHRSRAVWRSSTATRRPVRVAHLGPDLLGADWDPAVAAANLITVPDRPLAERCWISASGGRGQRLLQRVLFLVGLLPTAPVARRQRPATAGNRGPRHAVGQPVPLEPHHHRRHRGGRGLWVYGRAANRAAAAARRSSRTTAVTGSPTGARHASANRPQSAAGHFDVTIRSPRSSACSPVPVDLGIIFTGHHVDERCW